ncbi:MAG: ThiS family protein [Armatimonadetes bacterium]|jgi:molybdopterin converting factor small subunit|nr:ThiS family protein [Armatimonadota bacterium]
MANVSIPAPLRKLTGGATSASVPGDTLAEVIDRLDELHPGIKDRLIDDGRVRRGFAVFVDGNMPTTGLRTKLTPESEVYFAPAIAGGAPGDG